MLSILLLSACSQQEAPGKNYYDIGFFEERSEDYRVLINELIGFYDSQLKAVDKSDGNYIDNAIPLIRDNEGSLLFAIDYDAQVEFLSGFQDSTLSKIWYVDRLLTPTRETNNFGLVFNPYGEFLEHFNEFKEVDFELWTWVGSIDATGDYELGWYKPISAFQHADTSTIERKLFWILAAITVNDHIHRAKGDSSGPHFVQPRDKEAEGQEAAPLIFEETGAPEKNRITISESLENLPEQGIANFDYNKFYPGILDTVEDRRIVAASRLKMEPGNDIIVTILNNSGTFDQMFLCTHDSNSTLLNSYYIGKATMWDGTSHTIKQHILDNHTIRFDHVHWGINHDQGHQDVDTAKHYSRTLFIGTDGSIKEK